MRFNPLMSSARASFMARCLIALTLLLGLVYGSTAAFSQSGYKLIVNSDNPVSSLSKDEVSDYFLKKTSSWKSAGFDQRVNPLDLTAPPEVRNAFSEDVHGRSANAIKKYWQRLIFTGRGTPPREVDSDSEAISFVASTPGGIAYVSPSASLPGGVKAVSVSN
ncbi:MAG: hypothetical protein AAGD01_17705 [Acidobacteriota bacterium]